MTVLATTLCKQCGAEIVLVSTNDGRTVPLDPAVRVFHRVWDPETRVAFWSEDTGSDAMARHRCAKGGEN